MGALRIDLMEAWNAYRFNRGADSVYDYGRNCARIALEHIRKVSNEQGGCDYIDIDQALAELTEGR